MLFSYSFRIFFLLAFAFTAIFMFNWVLIYPGLISIKPLFNDVLTWHGHEMVYGFVTAVLTGFLLTAVATWTSTPPIKGPLLIVLTLVWVIGRVVVTFPLLPQAISSGIDLIYIPLFMMILAKPLWVTKNERNYVVITFLGLLFTCNTVIHLAHYELVNATWGYNALYGSIGVVLLFITLVAGRIIPFFTVNALKRHGVVLQNTPQKNMNNFAILSMLLFIGTLLYAGPMAKYTGYAALTVALVHGWRMRLWHTRHSIVDPLLWILHLGYLWMIIGMLLWFYSSVVSDNIPISISLHLITIGCIGSICLGMMARVALGHTGRPLEINRFVTLSFILLQLSIVSRLSGVFLVDNYIETISISGVLWLVAFVLYGIFYTPILCLPKVEEDSLFRVMQK